MVRESKEVEKARILVKREVITSNARWLTNSMVEQVKWEGVIPLVASLCDAHGIREVKGARLGGSKVLVSFRNLEEVMPLVNSLKFELEQIFM